MRAQTRGGQEGILRWHPRAISAYTWCVTEKGPQRKWLHRIGKEETAGCRCQQAQPGRDVVETCTKLAEVRREVEEDEMSRSRRKGER